MLFNGKLLIQPLLKYFRGRKKTLFHPSNSLTHLNLSCVIWWHVNLCPAKLLRIWHQIQAATRFISFRFCCWTLKSLNTEVKRGLLKGNRFLLFFYVSFTAFSHIFAAELLTCGGTSIWSLSLSHLKHARDVPTLFPCKSSGCLWVCFLSLLPLFANQEACESQGSVIRRWILHTRSQPSRFMWTHAHFTAF